MVEHSKAHYVIDKLCIDDLLLHENSRLINITITGTPK